MAMATARNAGPTRRMLAACGVAVGIVASGAVGQGDPLGEPFPAVFDLTALDGTLGFVIEGVGVSDHAGSSLAPAGDVNGDGIDDLLIGAPQAAIGGVRGAGAVYVVFGRRDAFSPAMRLADLDGDNGFWISGGAAGMRLGAVAGIGDVNGDGRDDIALRDEDAGFVIFDLEAATDSGARRTLSAMDGTNGVRIVGSDANPVGAMGRAGDHNNDGVADLLLATASAMPTGREFQGAAYVVFGRTTAAAAWPARVDVDDLDGANGFRIQGAAFGDYLGWSAAALGDANGDGIDDIVVGAPGEEDAVPAEGGAFHVVFGLDGPSGAAYPPALGPRSTRGYRYYGEAVRDSLGVSCTGLDFNADGLGDSVVTASGLDRAGQPEAGGAFVVFGQPDGAPMPPRLSDLDGANGVRIVGPIGQVATGLPVRSVGDVNGDGRDDLLLHAKTASDLVGHAYLVYGRDQSASGPFPAELDLATLDGQNGVMLVGEPTRTEFGGVLSPAGDVNGDGRADFMIAARLASPGGLVFAGRVYVVFGRGRARCPADLTGDGQLTAEDFLAFQNLFDAGDLAADFDGDGSLTLFDFLAFQNEFDAGCE